MASIRITDSVRATLEAVNPRLFQQYDAIVALIRRRVGPDHARLLAEPVLGGTGAYAIGLVWFAEGDGEAVSARDLPTEDRARVEAMAHRLVTELGHFAGVLEGEGPASCELARLLRDALVIPGPNFLWAVDGQPVLAGWGHRLKAGPNERVVPGFVMREIEAPQPAEPPPRPLPAPPVVAPPKAEGFVPLVPAARGSSQRWVAATAWVLAALLLFVLGDRLVRACAVGGPDWPAAIRAFLPDACPTALANRRPDMDLLAELRRAEAELHARELELTRRAITCKEPCSTPERRAAAPAPAVVDLERRLDQVERSRGLELTLAWEGSADLDLHVICPNGERIAFDNRQACDGRLVADLNSGGGGQESRPIEHVIWPQQAPEGAYQVMVDLYKRHEDTRTVIPYRVVVWYDGRIIRELSREVSQTGARERVLTFSNPPTP